MFVGDVDYGVICGVLRGLVELGLVGLYLMVMFEV